MLVRWGSGDVHMLAILKRVRGVDDDLVGGGDAAENFQGCLLYTSLQFSLHTNYCDLGFCLAEDGQRLVLVSCLDNLRKGAAGQAVQNMNLMYQWDEREGLQ